MLHESSRQPSLKKDGCFLSEGVLYSEAKTKLDKSQIVSKIVSMIQEKSGPGETP